MTIDPFAKSRLGQTDLFVPRFGLGTGPLGGWPTAVPREQARATIRHAWDVGIRYFDTAPFYGLGLSEENLGTILPEIHRDEYTLSTKVGRLLVPGEPDESLFKGVPPRRPVTDFSYEGTLRSLDASRERLGIERFDVALIHDPDERHDEAMTGAYRALADLREQGMLRAIGAGMNWSKPLTEFILAGNFDCMLCAGRYTLLEQDSLDDLLPAALERHVSLVAAGVYNSGLLVNPGPGSTYNYEQAPSTLIKRAKRLQDACAEFAVPLRAAAIQFPLAHPAVATVIVGARTPEEIDDNLAMLHFDIPAELWHLLKDRDLIRRDAPVPGGDQPDETVR